MALGRAAAAGLQLHIAIDERHSIDNTSHYQDAHSVSIHHKHSSRVIRHYGRIHQGTR